MRQGRPGQRPDQEVLGRYRAEAVEALLEATGSPHWQVRASAAVALGRMCEPTACRTLQTLAAADPVPSVRIFALVSLALGDLAGTEELLRSGRYNRSALREATLVALGLLRRLGPDTIVGLQKTLTRPDVAAAAIAAWGLRRQSDPANGQLLRAALAKTRSAWLASEATISFASAGRGAEATIAPLAEILLATSRGTSLPAWAAAAAPDGSQARPGARLPRSAAGRYEQDYKAYLQRHQQWQAAYKEYLQKHAEWREATTAHMEKQMARDWERSWWEYRLSHLPRAEPPEPAAKAAPLPPVQIEAGISRIYQSRLRGSAAIALGQIRDPRSTQALIRALHERDDRCSDLYKGFAVISLGQLGDPQSLPALLAILRAGRVDKGEPLPGSPLRGYAALALGLYARRDEGSQPQDRPQYDRVCQLLAERMADRRETEEVRSAAALALGLTRRTENLKHLQAASKSIGGQEALIGYTLLARGMLADTNILAPARVFLAVSKDKTDSAGILGRRAAVLGLGVLGRQEGIPILVDAWHLSYYVNRETALAMSLCQAYNAAGPLVKLLKECNAMGKSFAAQCLGELFTPERPSRLSRILNGTNYTMKSSAMIGFQLLANEFLFTYLIPATEASSGERWR